MTHSQPSKALVPVTAGQVQAAMSAQPYRTVRMGAVSIRQIGDTYSVRAAVSAYHAPNGRLVQTERVTRMYATQDQVASVVSAQCHGNVPALDSAPHKSIKTWKPTAALSAPKGSLPGDHMPKHHGHGHHSHH